SMAPTVLRSPPRPATDSFLRAPATEENQKIKSRSRSMRSQVPDRGHLLGCRPAAGTTDRHPRIAWIYRVDQGRHPPRAGHAIPTDRGNLSKAGWVRLRGCPRQGGRGQAYRDVFTPSPATGPTPPCHRYPAFDVDVDVDSAGAGRSPASNPQPSLFQEVVHQQM